MKAKEVSQLEEIIPDGNTLVPMFNEEKGLGKVTLENAKEYIGVSIDEVSANVEQGEANTDPSAIVEKTGTDNHQNLHFGFTIPKANQIENTTVEEDTTATRKQTVTLVNTDTTKNTTLVINDGVGIDDFTVTQNNNDSGMSNISVELSDGSTKSLNIKNGKGISSITEDNNTENGATRAITITYSDGTTSALSVKNGEGIDSVTVNQSSIAGATSTMTLTMSNGTTQTLSVKNGKDFRIKKSYASIAAMEADFENMEAYDFVMIDTGSVEDVDTGKLYYKGTSRWEYVGDLSGKQGIKGDTGVGIASLSFKESTVSSGINVLTVTLTDGTSQTFNIRNGAKGDTGERGTGVFAGTDSYTEVGHTKPIGPSNSTCDEGLIIEIALLHQSYTVPYKEGDIYISTQTNDVYKIHEDAIVYSGSVYAYYLYVEKIGNIQGKSVGSITAPSTVDTSNGAGNTYTVKDTDGNAIGTFTVYNANNTNADALTTARTFTIADADDTNSGTETSFDGSKNVTLHLPSTAKISITGNAATADTAVSVVDYGDTSKTIKIGFRGAGANISNLAYMAGYLAGGTQIKNVSKDVLQEWLGLRDYLPLSGGTMTGKITATSAGIRIPTSQPSTVLPGDIWIS